MVAAKLRCCMNVYDYVSSVYKQPQPVLGRFAIQIANVVALRVNILHYSDVVMSAMAPQITGVTIVYSTVCTGADQRKHQSSASLALLRGNHRWPMNSPHKGPGTRKIFSFDDVIMCLISNVSSMRRAWISVTHCIIKNVLKNSRSYVYWNICFEQLIDNAALYC